MHGQQPQRTAAFTGAQYLSLLEMLRPLVALDSFYRAVVRVGEFEQGYTIVPRQDHHGFAEVLLIEFNTNRQRHIEEVRFKLRRQALGLGQQASRCRTGGSRRGQCIRAQQ